MMLADWAKRWGIADAAIAELQSLILTGVNLPAAPISADAMPAKSEAWAQSATLLDSARHGVCLTRNNVGALLDDRGVPVRYGLWNESKERNAVFKSGDLVGIRKHLVTVADVGQYHGIFTMREIKKPGWVFNPKDAHEKAQLNCINFVLSCGGDAAFSTGYGSFK